MIPCAAVEPFVAWTTAWLAALLVAERLGSRRGVGLAKSLASAGFVAAALRSGAPTSGYAAAVLTGLALSWCGDVLLVPRGAPRVFLAGMAAFGAAHVAYLAAFALRGLDPLAAGGAALGMALFGLAVGRWLWPHLGREWRAPVLAYLGIISVMVVLAISTTAARGGVAVAAGAVLFAISDVSVARDRFVSPGFANGAWGLPLYYAAQLLLAGTVA